MQPSPEGSPSKPAAGAAREGLRADAASPDPGFEALFEHLPIPVWEEDFSEVRRHIEAIRASGVENLRAYFDEHMDEVATCAGLVRVLRINQTSVRFFGAESKDQVLTDLPRYFNEASLLVFRDELVALSEGATSFEGEIPVRTPDGRALLLQVNLSVVPGSERTLERVLFSFQDVTSRRTAGEALLRAQKLEALGTLAGGVARDFNNLLMMIRGHAAVAAGELTSDHPARPMIEEIDRAGSRAAALVRRILAFAQPEKRESVVQPLIPVLDEAIKLLRATVPALVEIRTEWDPNAPSTAIDAGQLQQVILNLVSNAVDAIGPRLGAIVLRLDSVEAAPGGAAVSPGLPPGLYTRLSVSDDGCGIDPANLERVLDPFFTTKPPGSGSGLGLSVVHGIMKSHGGGMSISSQPARGTTVQLFFPAATAALPEAPRTDASPAPAERGDRRHLLFVDDEASLLFLAQRLLGRLGYQVTTFENPAEALDAFRAEPAGFDALVTDISMPAMSGFDLASEILALRPGLPVVITSGYIRPEDERRAADLGARALIAKPNSVEEMAGALDRIFRASVS